MKNLLLLTLLVFFKLIYSAGQSTSGQKIIRLIEKNKKECQIPTHYNEDSCIIRWIEVGKLLKKMCFVKDSLMILYMNSNISYIKYFPESKFYNITSCRQPPDYYYYFNKDKLYKDYLESVQLENADLGTKLDSAIRNGKLNWIEMLLPNLKSSDIASLLQKTSSKESLSDILDYIISKRPHKEFPLYFNAHSNKFNATDYLYYSYVNLLSDCKTRKCSQLIKKEKEYFTAIYDSTKFHHRILFDYHFTRNGIVRDSIEHLAKLKKEKHIADSLNRLDSIRNSVATLTEQDFLQIIDSFISNNIIAHEDLITVFELSGHFFENPIWFYWTNSKRFNMLQKFSTAGLYELYKLGQMNGRYARMFFSMWLFRNLAGPIVVRIFSKEDDARNGINFYLYHLIENYASNYCDPVSLLNFMDRSKLKNKILLYFPNVKRNLYEWLCSERSCYKDLALDLLAFIMTEEIIIDLVNKIDQPLNECEKKHKMNFYEALLLIQKVDVAYLKANNPFKDIGIFTRNQTDVKNWMQHHIEPLRKRHHLPDL